MQLKYNGYVWAGLFVDDLEKEIAFYRDAIGLPFQGQENGYAFFDAGNGDLFELWPNGVPSPTPKTPAQQSLKVSFHVDNLDETVAELKARGVQFVGGIGEKGGTHWAIFVDPEGNLLELKQLAPQPASRPAKGGPRQSRRANRIL
ncbi:MAG: VOC family protein [Acidobacteria bacterium]|nr:VOC family protein [Acidobacteriota bacterium]